MASEDTWEYVPQPEWPTLTASLSLVPQGPYPVPTPVKTYFTTRSWRTIRALHRKRDYCYLVLFKRSSRVEVANLLGPRPYGADIDLARHSGKYDLNHECRFVITTTGYELGHIAAAFSGPTQDETIVDRCTRYGATTTSALVARLQTFLENYGPLPEDVDCGHELTEAHDLLTACLSALTAAPEPALPPTAAAEVENLQQRLEDAQFDALELQDYVEELQDSLKVAQDELEETQVEVVMACDQIRELQAKLARPPAPPKPKRRPAKAYSVANWRSSAIAPAPLTASTAAARPPVAVIPNSQPALKAKPLW
ncbi:hypothetical protein P167DRAFT_546866 [Morchella conica CCBAS932]|uniref:Uncharacterized protein n=1 Tax=Morchella conica CCBAS932 TaxID=1392247 RepID=A0A3N4KMU4_9PEZI|nr:hypothetical protein P167DRAFT_546866 [Morchella conica CCBAS932]